MAELAPRRCIHGRRLIDECPHCTDENPGGARVLAIQLYGSQGGPIRCGRCRQEVPSGEHICEGPPNA